jgi:hypothetical protein
MDRPCKATLTGAGFCVRRELPATRAQDVARAVEDALSGLPSDIADDFMKALGAFGKTAGSKLQSGAPGAAKGAAAGAAVGGPWGAAIGAGAGLASAFFNKSKTAPAPAPVIPTAGTVGTPVEPAAAPAAALPTGQGAAATLVSLLQNPTVQQALLSQGLGSSGSEQVLTPSGTSLPRTAVNNLLSQLLANASESLPESEEMLDDAADDFLRDGDGNYLVDPASPDQQAALVLSRLRAPGMSRRAVRDRDGTTSFESAEHDESSEWVSADGAETVEFY